MHTYRRLPFLQITIPFRMWSVPLRVHFNWLGVLATSKKRHLLGMEYGLYLQFCTSSEVARNLINPRLKDY